MTQSYTDDFLISELYRYYKEFGEVPKQRDFRNTFGYPSDQVYKKHFGSWNNALRIVGFQTFKYTNLNNKPNICEICSDTETSRWHDKNGLKVCDKCSSNSRNYLHGELNPDSNGGIAVITEWIVSNVLNDCIKCNIPEHFNFEYDLISEKYGTINVKSSKLTSSNDFRFRKPKKQTIPDYYICIGFNEDKSVIKYVWIVPGNSSLVNNSGISISLHNLERAKQYEVDATPYNEVYQNLDIYSLPEFINVNTVESEAI